jgi:hypothetical protein
MNTLRRVRGPIFKTWQHLTSPMPHVFIQDKCLLHLNFLLQYNFILTNTVVIV